MTRDKISRREVSAIPTNVQTLMHNCKICLGMELGLEGGGGMEVGGDDASPVDRGLMEVGLAISTRGGGGLKCSKYHHYLKLFAFYIFKNGGEISTKKNYY